VAARQAVGRSCAAIEAVRRVSQVQQLRARAQQAVLADEDGRQGLAAALIVPEHAVVPEGQSASQAAEREGAR